MKTHVDFIVKKASKKLHSLRILCRAGVAQDNILKVYLSTVRPVLEYAVSVWQAIPEVLFIRCSLGSSKNGFEEGNS